MIMKILLLATEQAINPTNWEKFVSFLANDAFKNGIAAATLIIAIIAGFRALAQWKESKRIKRAEYINEVTEQMRSDETFAKALKWLEYEDYEFRPTSFSGIDREHDQTLAFLSYICYLNKMKLITKEEFHFFDYKIARVLRNKNPLKHLNNTYHLEIENDSPISYYYLIEYGIDKKLLPADFTTKKYDDNSVLGDQYQDTHR